MNKNHSPKKGDTQHSQTGAQSSFSQELSSIRCERYETIMLGVARLCERKELERKKKALKGEMIEQHLRRAEVCKKKREELELSSEESHRKFLLKKKLDNEAIARKAEERALQSEMKDQQEIEAIRLQTRSALHVVVFKGISQCQELFQEKHAAVVKLLLACQHIDYSKRLKELIQQFEQLNFKIRGNDFGHTELKAAQRKCELLESLEQKIIAEIEVIIKETQRKREEELQKQQKQLQDQQLQKQQQHQKQQQLQKEQQQQKEKQQTQQQQQQQQRGQEELLDPKPLQQQQQLQRLQQENEKFLKNVAEEKTETIAETTKQAKSTEVNDPVSQNIEFNTASTNNSATIDEDLTTYSNIIAYYQSIVEKVKPLKNEESLKKYRFACQKAINIPINAISAVSPQHLQDKFEKLYSFINGQPLNDVRTTDHPLGRDYCLLLMAKKFVSQGATAVSSNQQAAFPIASVLISLWKLLPELGQLFLAYLYKESPYMVPCFLRQQPGQSAEDFLKQLGYHFTNGQIEPSELYLKRQAGLTRLYAACIITNGRQSDGPNHPHGLNNAWRWLSKTISMEPLKDLSATIIMEFLQIVGGPMLRTYGKQFVKLLFCLQTWYLPRLTDEGGPKARLELQFHKFLKERRIELPVGMMPPGYW